MKPWLDKAGSVGAVLAAAACPVCFPKLALIGALFGLGALGAYESQLFLATQAFVVVAVLGQMFSYRVHRNPWLLAVAMASGAVVFAALYWATSEALVYAGFAGLVAASVPKLWVRILPRKVQWNRN